MEEIPQSIRDILEFERATRTSSSAAVDSFYDLPDNIHGSAPGAPLKVEEETDASKYLLPPATALSRFIYQSEDLAGQNVPVSAFILWPYSPRIVSDGFPVVAWAHGTSGLFGNSAPSQHNNLWQHYVGPYQLALQGYVVTGTDYAGLGVEKTSSNTPIAHQYLASPAHANDIVYSIQAAQVLFPRLSKSFIVIGHSQGGGAAWAVAERQYIKPIDGYLGAVAISPFINLIDTPSPEPILTALRFAACPGIAHTFPAFNPADVLTPQGEQLLTTSKQSRAGLSGFLALLATVQSPLKPNWQSNQHVQNYAALSAVGNKPLVGPLLIFHGEADIRLNVALVTKTVEETAARMPNASIEYILLSGVTHTPAITAGQVAWMQWIDERFATRDVQRGYHFRRLEPARPAGAYAPEQNWYLERAREAWQAP